MSAQITPGPLTTRINGTRITLGFTRDGIPFIARDKRGGMRVTTRFPQGESVARAHFVELQQEFLTEAKCLRGEHEYFGYSDLTEGICSNCGE